MNKFRVKVKEQKKVIPSNERFVDSIDHDIKNIEEKRVNRMHNILISIPEDVHELVKKIAQSEDRSIRYVLKRIIVEHINNKI